METTQIDQGALSIEQKKENYKKYGTVNGPPKVVYIDSLDGKEIDLEELTKNVNTKLAYLMLKSANKNPNIKITMKKRRGF